MARNPATLLHAYTCLPLRYAPRQAAGAILQDVVDSGVLFAILMCRHKDDTYLMLLTTHSDTFYHLKDCSSLPIHRNRIHIETILLKSNVLSEVQRSLLDGGMLVEDLPPLPPRSGSSSHLGHPGLPTDSPYRSRVPSSGTGGAAALWHFIYPISAGYIELTRSFFLQCMIKELVLTKLSLEGMKTMALAIKICNRVCQWVKDVENEIFLLGASPFSW
ncbi:hypothetical protein PIB30_015278 [Stylosanthes scabra]|uniref:Vacuolar fusion protein MON1 homolog n=1 Tax=Stylosanthes scabra TaxID=79078 RepID=A0ABU6Y8W8_9FABA|nr:hypothetical protein [Stylosanthes scabra]